MSLVVGSLPIRSLRASFANGFAEWDESVARKDQGGARAARRRMQAAASALIPRPVADLPGWYFFVNTDRATGADGLNYLGIAKSERRTIARRIMDRFKDDSCLDTTLDDLSDLEQRVIATRRLLAAMPKTGANYVEKHMAAARLVRGSSHILMVGTFDPPFIVEEVERLLIGRAVRAGAPLINIQHRRFRSSVSQIAYERSEHIVDALRSLGMPQAAATALSTVRRV